jgi:hypothetical protein
MTSAIDAGCYHMNQTLNHRIRERAYEIWCAHGCPDGQAEQHWLTAEREILNAGHPLASAPEIREISATPKTSLSAQAILVKKSRRVTRKKTATSSPSA